MFVTRISIHREGFYERIVAIVADEVAAAGRATAKAMTAEIIVGQSLLAAE